MSSTNLRRSTRIKAQVKYTEDVDEKARESSPPADILKDEIEKELADIEEDVQKPLELFSEKDISGRKLYGFQSPTKKNNMMLKASQCRTPETPKSLKTLPMLKIVLDKILTSPKKKDFKADTKNTDREVSRKRCLPSVNSSGDESVSEDSEYVPTDSEVSSESSEISNDSEKSDVSDEEDNARKKINQTRIQKLSPKHEVQNTPKKTKRGRNTVAYREYHIKTDKYFESQSEKTITSDHILRRLRNVCLTEETLKKLLVNQCHISTIHKKSMCSLTENYKLFFPMWQFIIEEGYCLLLYGLGSKRNLINDFHNTIIADHPTLVINGFFPSLSIRDILRNIIVNLLDLDCPANTNDCIELIENILRNNSDDQLYLIIHNIDGIMLRSNQAQNVLASLAAIRNIRMIASVDHINAPLLWDHTKCAKFNFYWWDVTTLMPYQAETTYENSLLVQQNGGLALCFLEKVFLSLNSNARTIYLILVKYQLNNSNNNFTGMPFKDLYRAAREQFAVSSDLALREQLIEFVDHKLIRTKRTFDGTEHLTIPLNNSLLKQFMEQHGS